MWCDFVVFVAREHVVSPYVMDTSARACGDVVVVEKWET